MSYDSAGKLTGTTDPLSHQTGITLASSGLVTQVTDPLQHAWQFGYDHGDLTSLTDPLASVRSQFVDEAGRVIASTDPLGRVAHGIRQDQPCHLRHRSDRRGDELHVRRE